MKRTIIIVLSLIMCFICKAQDACYNIYVEALQEYNKGNYLEAQRRLVVVAQTCGDYSDVWNKLKNCNKKLAEQQSQQVSSLSNEKQQLEAELKKSESENNKKLADAIGQTHYYKEQCKGKTDSLQLQVQMNLTLRDSVEKLNLRLDSITRLLDSANSQIKKAKQQDKPNKEEPNKKEANNKKGANKETSSQPKQIGRNHSNPSNRATTLEQDTVNSETSK